VKIAWDKRDGYTFGDEERELLGNTDARAAIKLAMKLLDKSPPPLSRSRCNTHAAH
jgi:hypothetical protein